MDSIANMITAIKNAVLVNKTELYIPNSDLRMRILEVLKKTGYISDAKAQAKGNKSIIKITLKYQRNKNVINNIKQISRPGLRIYKGYKDIPRVLGGTGEIIISTPKGIMIGKEARTKKLGGELICEVY